MESALYRGIEGSNVSKGNFFSLFTNKDRFLKYLKSILIGLPQWFTVGILITFSPEFAKTLAIDGTVSAGKAVTFCYLGFVFGDFASGLLSQYLKTRKVVVLIFQAILLIVMVGYFMIHGVGIAAYYMMCVALGFGGGYWAILITIAAEQFGTNIRATVASTVPNFIRGMLIPITIAFTFARGHFGLINGAAIVGAVCLLIACYSLFGLEETFHKDLNYIED
ncbi:major facilitator superfamily protein [Candidatus Magnetoovum chiemensis]|nr:major facilitator superfamily protein [Candidatus Magnetoovum chiemensis]